MENVKIFIIGFIRIIIITLSIPLLLPLVATLVFFDFCFILGKKDKDLFYKSPAEKLLYKLFEEI